MNVFGYFFILIFLFLSIEINAQNESNGVSFAVSPTYSRGKSSLSTTPLNAFGIDFCRDFTINENVFSKTNLYGLGLELFLDNSYSYSNFKFFLEKSASGGIGVNARFSSLFCVSKDGTNIFQLRPEVGLNFGSTIYLTYSYTLPLAKASFNEKFVSGSSIHTRIVFRPCGWNMCHNDYRTKRKWIFF